MNKIKPYCYKVYNNQFKPRRFIMSIEANSPNDAIKKAGFDWMHTKKTRRGMGYTNTAIYVYAPETVAGGSSRPDFIMERVFC